MARPLVYVLLVSFLLTLGGPALAWAAPPTIQSRSVQSGSSVLQAAPTPPKITAPAAIVVEYPSGKILYAKNAHDQRPEASTTKTMTALLALQRVALTDVVTATAADL